MFVCSLLLFNPTETFAKNEQKPRIQVVAITEDFASIAKSIGGERVKVSALVKGSKNLHNVQAKPSMVLKVKHADLLIRLGMQQDSWIDGLIQVGRNANVTKGRNGYLDASKYIDKLEVPTEKLDGSHGDVHISGNPHYWLDPNNGKVIAKQIVEHLSLIDPESSPEYEKNYQSFVVSLDKKIQEWKQKMKTVDSHVFIAYHKVWSYFFQAFDLYNLGDLEPLPGIPPTARHVAELKKLAKEQDEPIIVLTANFYPKHVGTSFAKDIGGSFYHLPTNVGEQGIESYDELFDYIVNDITKGHL